MNVNCIGDSHISAFFEKGIIHNHSQWFKRDIFNVNHAGPVLAFTLDAKESIINLCKSVPKNEQILLCFGEIDCRAQVGKHISDSKD